MGNSLHHKIYEFDDFRLHCAERMLYRDGIEVPLSPKAVETLMALVERSGQIVSKDELISAVWPDTSVDESNLFLYLSLLRKTLGTNKYGKPWIETLRRRGYRFSRNVNVASVQVPNGPIAIAIASDSEPNNLTNQDSAPSVGSRYVFLITLVMIAICVILFGSFYLQSDEPSQESVAEGLPPHSKLYWELTEREQYEFLGKQFRRISTLMGDAQIEVDDEALGLIKLEVDRYVERRESLSQKPFKEGMRPIYGRGSQLAPVINREYTARGIPPVLGLYQPVIESEYHDCLIVPVNCAPLEKCTGPIGLYQFTRKTGLKYDMAPSERCNSEKQIIAAAKYTSDLMSDFGQDGMSATLFLLAFNEGETATRDHLRQLRKQGIRNRNFWTILRNLELLEYEVSPAGKAYVPRFFAAAIIGENPAEFGLSTPPLTTIK